MPFTHMHQGPLFRDFIVSVLARKAARGYLEVGVREGATLSLVDCPSIGVDPAFQLTMNVLGKKRVLHLYQMTSDEFFREHDPRAVLGTPIDVIFLDGLHQFEFLLRDFINSEAVSHRDTVIMLDDCLPVNVEMTERYHKPEERIDQSLARWWTGDVWKVLPILTKYRPDLHIICVDVQPTGIICITNLDPKATILRDKYYDIVREFVARNMNDDALMNFYQNSDIVPASAIMSGFDASLSVGP
jgi:hypothetical protein